jgi:hypothetical protein
MCTTSTNFLGQTFASGKRWIAVRVRSARCGVDRSGFLVSRQSVGHFPWGDSRNVGAVAPVAAIEAEVEAMLRNAGLSPELQRAWLYKNSLLGRFGPAKIPSTS